MEGGNRDERIYAKVGKDKRKRETKLYGLSVPPIRRRVLSDITTVQRAFQHTINRWPFYLSIHLPWSGFIGDFLDNK